MAGAACDHAHPGARAHDARQSGRSAISPSTGPGSSTHATRSPISGHRRVVSSIEAIVIYVDTGTEATSPLVAFIDTATGLPITPNGGDKQFNVPLAA